MKALLILASATLSGCVYVPHHGHSAPRVRYYELLEPLTCFNQKVIPYRSKDYIGYIDHRGTLHIWPVK